MAPQRTPTFPNGSDYVDALQNPHTAFTDPDLQAATVKQDQLGFPRPLSGNFASVFKVTGPAGQWAVKCFTRPVAHQQQRYAAIDTALKNVHHAALVHFNYQPHGVTIKGDPFPLLKMEWAEAQELLRWLDRHHTDQEKVFHLAGQLVDVIAALEGAGIAHGDLQHGNLLVTDAGKLILVDYDGMYAPALAGYPATERGLAHYQHPARGDADYGPRLDRFSAWVIYTSLYAIATNPRLWRQLRGKDDERLLFTSDDYLDPGNSTAFTTLCTLGDPQLKKLGGALASYAGMSTLDRIPALDPPAVLGAASTTIPTPRAPLTDTGQLPDWLTDHVQPAAVPAAPTPANHVPDLPLQRFPRDRRLAAARITAATGLLGVAGGVWGDRLMPINPMFWYALAGLAVLVVRWMYKHHPQVLARLKAAHDYQIVKQSIAEAEEQLTAAQRHLVDLEMRRQHRQASIDAERSAAAEQSKSAVTAASNALRNAMQQLSAERAKLGDGTPLRHRLIADKRRQHVETELRNALIAKDPPEEINTLRTQYLAQQGFRSAADFVDYYVSDHGGRGERTYLRRTAGGKGVYVKQIGKGCAGNLLAWRNSIKERAEQSAPRTLTTAEEASVRAQLRQEEARLKQQAEAAERQRATAVSTARSQERRLYTELEAQQTQLDTDTRSEGNNLQRLKTHATSELRTARTREGRQAKVVASYTGITGIGFVQAMAWVTRY